MKINRAVLFVSLISLLLVSMVAASDTDDYFPLQLDNQWSYEITINNRKATSELRVSQQQTINGQNCMVVEKVFNGVAQQKEYYLVADNGVFTVMRSIVKSDFVFNPYQILLKYPVKIGDSWSQEGTMTITGRDRTVTYRMTSYYQSFEDVQVPAGNFRAVKLVMSSDLSDGARVEWIQYYAPGVGVVKESGITTTQGRTIQSSTVLINAKVNNRSYPK